MLTEEQVTEKANLIFLIDYSKRRYFKVLDYSDNPLAPEKTAYKLHFTDLLGNRKKVIYYPNTVGFQSL